MVPNCQQLTNGEARNDRSNFIFVENLVKLLVRSGRKLRKVQIGILGLYTIIYRL
jgi:hypothetical protein